MFWILWLDILFIRCVVIVMMLKWKLHVEALQGLSWTPFSLAFSPSFAFMPNVSSAMYVDELTHRSLTQASPSKLQPKPGTLRATYASKDVEQKECSYIAGGPAPVDASLEISDKINIFLL